MKSAWKSTIKNTGEGAIANTMDRMAESPAFGEAAVQESARIGMADDFMAGIDGQIAELRAIVAQIRGINAALDEL